MGTPWVAEQQGLFQTPHDLLNLHVIEFSRLNGYWPNELEAIEAICSWIVGTTKYAVVRCESSATFPAGPTGQTGSILGRTTKNLPASTGTDFTPASSVRKRSTIHLTSRARLRVVQETASVDGA